MNHYKDLENITLYRLKEGDPKAYTTLFDTYHRLLYALAFRYLKSVEEAEDAVQYTFMKIWEQRTTFDFTTGIRSLLFTILKNYIMNELRHRKIVFEKHYQMAQEESGHADDFIETYKKEDFRQQVMKVIEQLPPQKRMICVYKIEKELSNQEIADKMNLTVATVKSHYTVALKMLRKEISKLMVLLVSIFLN